MNELIAKLKELEKFNNQDVPQWVWQVIEGMKPKGDLISRQDAIELFEKYSYPIEHDMGSVEYGMTLYEIKQVLEEVPSVERTGEWIKHHTNGIEDLECSECGCWFLHDYLVRNSYCPNCGARMVSEE